MAQEDIFKKLVAHCKEYGYVFQSSNIYMTGWLRCTITDNTGLN